MQLISRPDLPRRSAMRILGAPLLATPAATALAAAAGLLATAPAQAAGEGSGWPAGRAITWMVGFAPGGTVDVLTRIAARKLAERSGATVVVENRPGASGVLALTAAARATPDGGTLISIPGPILFKTPVPEIGRELMAVGGLGQGPMVLVGNPGNGAQTLAEVLTAARQNAKAWSFATSGNGTSQHLAGELLNTLAGTNMTHVPYKGGGQAVIDVVSGQVPLGMLGVTPVLAHIRSGKLKAYAVTTSYRIDSLPGVPTMQESGLKAYDAAQWFVVAAPKGTPADMVARLNTWLAEIAATPEMQAALLAAGSVPLRGSAREVATTVEEDTRRWKDLAQRAKLDLD